MKRTKAILGAATALLLLAAAPAGASYELTATWGGYGSEDGQFNFPQGVDTDSDDNVFVADTGNDRIQKFDSSGTFVTKWGSEGTGDGQFAGPVAIATDSHDNVYVADRYNNRIHG
jgi:tripartite motif-containing protein 71